MKSEKLKGNRYRRVRLCHVILTVLIMPCWDTIFLICGQSEHHISSNN